VTTFTPAASWVDLFAQETPRDYGKLMSLLDPFAVKVSVQIAVRNATEAIWDADGAAWDMAVWDDPDFATWEDVTDRVRGTEWDRGSTDPLLPAEVGTWNLTLDNADGLVSPWATSGPFTNPVNGAPVWDSTGWDETVPGSGASLFRPGTPVRLGATYRRVSGTDAGGFGYFAFFSGVIETIEEDSEEGADSWVSVGLVDVSSALADAGSGGGTDGGGELVDGHTADHMLSGLLSDAEWPYGGWTTAGILGTDLFLNAPLAVPDATDNRLVAAQTICASVDVAAIAGAEGTLWFNALGYTVDTGYTFSNDPAPGELPLPVDGVTPYSSTDRLLNVVTGTSTQTGAVPQTATDPVSVDIFRRRATALGWPRSDLMLKNDSDVLALVTRVVNRQANDFLGISGVSVDADMDPERLFFVLSFLAAKGLQPPRAFGVRWVHVSGDEWHVTVYLVGFGFSLTMEGEQAKFTADLRTGTTT